MLSAIRAESEDFMNLLTMVLNDIKEKISKQNFSLNLYDRHSVEFQVARVVLNTTLETLQKSGYIEDYDFLMNEDGEILRVFVKFGDMIKAEISESEVKI